LAVGLVVVVASLVACGGGPGATTADSYPREFGIR
jgi:hypothetical protein